MLDATIHELLANMIEETLVTAHTPQPIFAWCEAAWDPTDEFGDELQFFLEEGWEMDRC